MAQAPRKTFKKTLEVLEMAEAVHWSVKAYYEEKTASVEDPRAAMLLEYIDGKEKELQSTIARYRSRAGGDILDAYFQFTPGELKALEGLTRWRPEPGASVDDVLSTALEFDSLMQLYYRRAAEMAPNESVRDMFENLAAAVRTKEQKEVRNATQMKDI